MPIENEAFFAKADAGFRTLFAKAKDRNELHFAMALMAEMRGAQDAGWNTAHEANTAYGQYIDFIESETDNRPIRARVALAFYCHMAEAGGLYEIPKNMLRIVDGKPHVLWPFSDLVEAHRITGDRIAPNANKVLKDLSGHAAETGMMDLAEVFRDAFNADLRNGFAHADYVLWNDGVRLPKRNGGHGKIFSWDDVNALLQRGIGMFETLRTVVNDATREYLTPRTILTSLSGEPPCNWTIYADEEGRFGITSGEYPRLN
jgi:hypothetical protein